MSRSSPTVSFSALLLSLLSSCTAEAGMNATNPPADNPGTPASSVHDLTVQALDGETISLDQFRDQVMVVVNVASRCGFTSQYAGLQELYDEYRDKGVVVVGFPSNDFGGQEPGSPEEIIEFCSTNYGVEFPMMEKVRVRGGEGQAPIYQRLQKMAGSLPSWNFGKYVVSRDGRTARYFGSNVRPESDDFRSAIDEALQ